MAVATPNRCRASKGQAGTVKVRGWDKVWVIIGHLDSCFHVQGGRKHAIF